MFDKSCYSNIRDLEAFLYGGPETVEHVYEREDNFQALHIRRRGTEEISQSDSTQCALWYSAKVNQDNGQIEYEISNSQNNNE